MENQHRKISGYRELTQFEIDLMNKIKAKGEELKALAAEVDSHLESQLETARRELNKRNHATGAGTPEGNDPDIYRIHSAQPAKWLAVARTDFQTGLMALTRAVAQPTTF